MRAIIYARVSSDTSGRAQSVTQQVAECTNVCNANGWNIFQVITDNSVGASRHSAGTRSGYARLLTLLQAGDVLVMWESSRGTRNLAEFVEFRDLCAERNVLYNYKNRTYDMRSGDDRFATGFDALRDEAEAERTRDRVMRASRARALAGEVHSFLPYGYRRHVVDERTLKTEWVVDEAEAAIVREIAHRILSGETTYRIALDLNARGVVGPSKRGSQPNTEWHARRIRRTMLLPSLAGKRVHKGEIIGDGVWEPILTEDEHRRLTAILTDPARRSTDRGIKPVHLLTGIAVCGVCGEGVRFFGPASQKTPRYLCPKNHVGRRADRVDEAVTAKMLELLEDPRILSALGEPDDEEGGYGAALARAQEIRQTLDGFYAEAAAGRLSPGGLAAVESRLLAELAVSERLSRRPVRSGALSSLASAAVGWDDTSALWGSLPIEAQRESIRAAMTVKILPQPAMGRRWDSRFVEIAWRTS